MLVGALLAGWVVVVAGLWWWAARALRHQRGRDHKAGVR